MNAFIKKGKVKVERSREGTIFEIAATLLVLAMWVVVLFVALHSGTDTTGAAADMAGDNAADLAINIVIGLTGTFVVALALVSAYHPDTMVNIPVRVHTAEGWLWVTRMVRVVALELALLFIATPLDGAFLSGPILTILTSVILLLTLVVFCVIVAKKR